jgi:hypothetical protein
MPFRVVFSYTTDTHRTEYGLRPWKEADIRCISEKKAQVSVQEISAANHQAMPSARRVRFEPIELQVMRSPDATVAAAIPPTPSLPEHIQDLCEAIMRLDQPQRDACIGYLLDNLQRKHSIYLLEPKKIDQDWKAYTLRDILERQVQAQNIRRLSQLDKLRIAVDLASSVLQLYKTPWLSDDWGKEDVFFIQRPGDSPAAIYEHPFMHRRFISSAAISSLQTSVSARPAFRVIRNQTLYTLGILLIELWYGKTMDQLQKPCDLDCGGTPGVQWCTADRLVEEEIEFEAGKRCRCNLASMLLCILAVAQMF